MEVQSCVISSCYRNRGEGSSEMDVFNSFGVRVSSVTELCRQELCVCAETVVEYVPVHTVKLQNYTCPTVDFR